MLEGKIKIRYSISQSKSETVAGIFHAIIPFSEGCSMICVRVGKICKLIPLENTISIDILEPREAGDDSGEPDVMVG
jgi:hypothetical protein